MDGTNGAQCTAEAAYDFYGVGVKIRSNSAQIISLFDRAFEFFRHARVVEPHLEMTLLVKDGDLADAENRQIHVRVPSSFDAWGFSIQSWVPKESLALFQESIQKLRADGGGEGYQLYRIGKLEGWAGKCFGGLELLVIAFVMHHLPHLCTLHAGVVSRNGRGLLICGTSGSGKSTLSYALARRGFRYLTDEFALFSPASLQVFPFPRAIGFKPGAAALFPELKPVLEDNAPMTHRSRLASLENMGVQLAREAAKACFLLFVSHEAGAPPQLTPLAAPEAVEALEKSRSVFCLAPGETRSFTRNEATEALCNYARCYRLISGDLDKTVGLIESLVAGP